VLAPAGKSVPIDGSTIKLYIDGVHVPLAASYNHPRPDVKAYVPGLANSDGPEARFTIDTTQFAEALNGLTREIARQREEASAPRRREIERDPDGRMVAITEWQEAV